MDIGNRCRRAGQLIKDGMNVPDAIIGAVRGIIRTTSTNLNIGPIARFAAVN